AEAIARRLGSGDGPTVWRFPWLELDRRHNARRGEQAGALANAWEEARRRWRGTGEGSGHVRLLVNLDGAGAAAGWVVRALSEPDVGAGAVSVDPGRPGRVHWAWPLQVGCLDD